MFTKCFYGVGLPCNTQVKLHEVAMESFRNPKKKLAVIICSEMCNCSETVRNSCKVFIGFSDLISGLVEYNMPGFKPRFLHGASAATWDRLRGNAALRRSFQALSLLSLLALLALVGFRCSAFLFWPFGNLCWLRGSRSPSDQRGRIST